MMCFNTELVKEAQKILVKNVKFVDELYDVTTINNILANQAYYRSKIAYLIDLNKSFCNKYPEINIIDNLSKELNWKIPNDYTSSQNAIDSERPEFSNLRMDRYCILARVLKSAGKIAKLSDFFEKDYIEAKENDQP